MNKSAAELMAQYFCCKDIAKRNQILKHLQSNVLRVQKYCSCAHSKKNGFLI